MKLLSFFSPISTVFLVIFLFSCSDDSDNNNPVDPDPTTNVKEGMVLITAENASFEMGSNNGNTDEQPVHTVSFTYNFWMDSTEVTQADYDQLMSSTYSGYYTPTWNSTYGAGDDYPVYSVYWDDAALYCNARSKRDGLDTVYSYTSITGTPGSLSQLVNIAADLSKNGYRLPTEAEWEYACRAGTSTDFYWGKDYNPYPSTAADTTEINNFAVWETNSFQFGTGNLNYGTHQVGAKEPNAYGLYDMSGNVYEWCHDWYDSYAGETQTDPSGPENGTWHAVRGGSWGNYPQYLRTANRTFSVPAYLYYFLGFRVVLPE